MLADRAFTLVDVQAILRESLVTEVAVLEVDKPAAVAIPEEVGDVPIALTPLANGSIPGRRPTPDPGKEPRFHDTSG
jgi:hypothetical protein